MMNLTPNQYEFNTVFSDNYSTITYNKTLALVVCKADTDYIPINDFKRTFLFISELIETNKIHHFVFDKHNLKTFHQPSMEWYFTIWKPSLKARGLVNHYKILPDLEWFAKAVEAGRYEILQKYGTDILEGITITYVKSVEEAIAKITENKTI